MKEQKLYVCEYCNTSYNDENKALNCESNHRHPKSINKALYRSIKSDKTGYPQFINIEMDDGKVIRYERG